MIVHECAQHSAEWMALRLGIPTASGFSKIMTAKGMKPSIQADKYLDELLAEYFIGEPAFQPGSGFMDRGTALEDGARSWYEMQRDVDVRQVGFITRDDGMVGYSPDGLVGDDGCIEIKCPAASTQVRYLTGGGVDDEYRGQVQGGLYVAQRAWCDVVAYSPALPSVIVRVERDEAYIAALAKALDAFVVRLIEGRTKLAAMGAERHIPNLAAENDVALTETF